MRYVILLVGLISFNNIDVLNAQRLFGREQLIQGKEFKNILDFETIDLDKDEDLDVLFIQKDSNLNLLGYYENLGDGKFDCKTLFDTLVNDTYIFMSEFDSSNLLNPMDVNGDDIKDLFHYIENYQLHYYETNGDFTFSRRTLPTNIDSSIIYDQGDINGDGLGEFSLQNSRPKKQRLWFIYLMTEMADLFPI